MRHLLPLLLIGAFIPALAGAQPSPVAARKHALLIGVTRLLHYPAASLEGPANDVKAMRRALVERSGFRAQDVEVLEGPTATRAGIEQAIQRRLVAPVRPGDLALFYFSGPGGTAVEGGAASPPVGALAPADLRDRGTLLSAPALAGMLDKVPTRELAVILDTSGAGAGAAIRPPARSRSLPAASAPGGEGGPAAGAPRSWHALIEGMKPAAVLVASAGAAVEFPFSEPAPGASGPMGAFTRALSRVLWTSSPHLSAGRIRDRVRTLLVGAGFDQAPVLLSEPERPLLALSGEAADPAPGAKAAAGSAAMAAEVISIAGSEVRLKPLGEGSLVVGGILAAPTRPEGGAGAVFVDGVSGKVLVGRLLGGKVTKGDLLEQTFRPVSFPRLRVALEGTSAALPALRSRLARLDFLELDPESAPTLVRSAQPGAKPIPIEAKALGLDAPDVTLAVEDAPGEALLITPFRNQQRLPALPAAGAGDAAARVERLLSDLRAVRLLGELDNPDSDLEVEAWANGQAADEVRVGEKIAFTLRSNRDCYVYVLDVDPAGQVTLLFPNRLVPRNLLSAGKLHPIPAPNLYRLTVQGPPGLEMVKVIASEQPLSLDQLAGAKEDLRPLSEGVSRLAPTLLRSFRSEINRLSSAGPEVTRFLSSREDLQPIATRGWAARTVYVRVRD